MDIIIVHQTLYSNTKYDCVDLTVSLCIFVETEENVTPKEVKRPRLDTGRDIFTQLTSVFEDLPAKRSKLDKPIETVNSDGDTAIIHISDPTEEAKAQFAKRNIHSIQQLNGRLLYCLLGFHILCVVYSSEADLCFCLTIIHI